MADPQSDSRILEFNISQYEEHRRCLLAAVQEEREMERYVLIGSAAFYSWLATQSASLKSFVSVASFIPAVIVFLSTMRMHALANGISAEAGYLRLLEVEIYKSASSDYAGPVGWERFVDANGTYGKTYEMSKLLFWYSLLGLTLILGLTFLVLES